jgi:hypothetical protein
MKGECDMKLGTFVFLLMMILISFGYVLSHDQETQRRLKEALNQNEYLNSQFGQASQQLNACQETIQNDLQIISNQKSEIQSLRTTNFQQADRIAFLENELLNFSSENHKLQTIQSTIASFQLDPVVFAVLLVAQLILFVVYRRRKKGYVRLSGEELAVIIKMRRDRKM